MTGFQISNLMHHVNILQPVVLFGGTVISFLTAVNNKHVNFYLPFISETGAHAPEVGIFSFTLIMGSILGIILILYRYVSVYLTTPAEKNILLKLNKLSLIIGIFSMIGLAGVAAFPMSTVFSVHLLAAGIFFGNFMLYTLVTTVYTYKKENSSSKLLKFRVILSILIFIVLIFLIIMFPISLKNWGNLNKTPPAIKEPENKGFTLILISSILEWLYMSLSLLYTLTLFIDLQKHPLKLTFDGTTDVFDTQEIEDNKIQNDRDPNEDT